MMIKVLVIFFFFLLRLQYISSSGEAVMTFLLEKPTNFTSSSLQQLRASDLKRHMHLLFQRRTSSSSSSSSIDYGVSNFTVYGVFDPQYSAGSHYTRVKLGTPPTEYYVQIDTGASAMWVNCAPCPTCPTTSALGIGLGFFDPSNSATAAHIRCSDPICDRGSCSSSTCSYSIGDGSGRMSGYYLTDLLHLDRLDSVAGISSRVAFGCTNYVSGYLTESYRAVDGVFGLGPNHFSVFSQLAAHGSAPKVFSHCLRGGGGGGLLFLGRIELPGITYIPLHSPIRSHYTLDLLSISVNRRKVRIDPDVFANSGNRGTIVDSSTQLACLVSEAYDPFVDAIFAALPPGVRQVSVKENQCFHAPSSDVFPLVSLNFAGGSMVLKPGEYLVQNSDYLSMSQGEWCVGFQKCEGLTILGELLLKDKVIIYDMDLLRFGWVEYDCSLPVGVSSGSSSSVDLVVGFALYMFLFLC